MASRGINKAILVGNCGAAPEVRYTAGGTCVANVNLATSDAWRDKASGEMQERTEWHRVVFFARQAEVVGEYVTKGMKLYVEGRLQTRKWQNKEGQDVYTTEVVASEMQMLGGGQEGGPQRSHSQRPPPRQTGGQRGGFPQQHGPGSPSQQQGGDPGFDDDLDDDIPF